MTIRVNLKPFRQAREFSQEQLARQIDMTLGTIQHIESKKAKSITFETLEKICKALDCTPGDLIQIED